MRHGVLTSELHEGTDMKSFDRSIRDLCRDLARKSSRDPKLALHLFRTAGTQRKAAARRSRAAAGGVHGPPLMIVSVTRRCNLRCAGCFVHEHGRPAGNELTTAELHTILTDARDLGVSVVALAGGEPLTRPEILDVVVDFPEILFPLVTNGSLLDDRMLAKLQVLPNVIPVISLEGFESDTDSRRGCGVYRRALDTMARLEERRILFGTSLMVTRSNFGLVTSRRFVRNLVDRGARLFLYVDYVPIKAGTEALVPSETQRDLETLTMMLLRKEFRAVFVASSASEEAHGGCQAAGRGFVHISSEGDLEPCPFSPFSDTSLRQVPLRVALQSRLLREVRESGEHLSESAGGCALWTKRDWVRSLIVPGGGEPAAPGDAAVPTASDFTSVPKLARSVVAASGAVPSCEPDPTETRRAA